MEVWFEDEARVGQQGTYGAPQLNPVENVWAFLRANSLNRRVWNSYDDIVDACCAAWNAFIGDAARVRSVTQRTWATVSS